MFHVYRLFNAKNALKYPKIVRSLGLIVRIINLSIGDISGSNDS